MELSPLWTLDWCLWQIPNFTQDFSFEYQSIYMEFGKKQEARPEPFLEGLVTKRRISVSWFWTVWESAHCNAPLASKLESTTIIILLPINNTGFAPSPSFSSLIWPESFSALVELITFSAGLDCACAGGERTLAWGLILFKQKLGNFVPVLAILRWGIKWGTNYYKKEKRKKRVWPQLAGICLCLNKFLDVGLVHVFISALLFSFFFNHVTSFVSFYLALWGLIAERACHEAVGPYYS